MNSGASIGSTPVDRDLLATGLRADLQSLQHALLITAGCGGDGGGQTRIPAGLSRTAEAATIRRSFAPNSGPGEGW